MRYYLIISETAERERKIEVLHSTNDASEAIQKLVEYSNNYESLIIEGKNRILMTTYEQD